MMKFVFAFFALVMAASVGMYGGLKYTEGVLKKNDYLKEQISDQIAVVNLDEGIEIDGEKKYYSESLIAALGDGYTIETPSSAQAGMESGTYGAIITFPVNTSTCIESVNSASPVQLQIDYSINNNLDNSSYAQTVSKIADFRKNINNMISYTYIVSIISSVHDAQDTADQLFTNNEAVLTALDDLELLDYVEALEIGSLPELNFQPEDLEIATYLNEANNYADDVSGYYLASYHDAQNDFDGIQAALSENAGIFDERLNLYMTGLNSWRTAADAHCTDVLAYNDQLRTYHQALDEYNQANSQQAQLLGDYIRAYNEEVTALNNYRFRIAGFRNDTCNAWNETYNSIVGALEPVSNLITAVAAYRDSVENYNDKVNTYRNATEAYISYLESQPVVICAPDVQDCQADPDAQENAQDCDNIDANDNNNPDDDAHVSSTPMTVGQLASSDPANDPRAAYYTALNELNYAESEMNTAGNNLVNAVNAVTLFDANNIPLTDEEGYPLYLTNAIFNSAQTYNEYINGSAGSGNNNHRMPSEYIYEGNTLGLDLTAFNPDMFQTIDAPQTFDPLAQFTFDVMPEWDTAIDTSADEIVRLSETYNPLDYLSDSVTDQIRARHDRFSSYSYGIENMMNSTYDSNINRMRSELNTYTNYVNNMRNTAVNTYNEEQEAFQESVTAYGDEIRALNESNNELIGSFVTMMPNSRSGADVNTNVVDAIVEPIGFNSQSAPVTAETTSFNNVTSKLVYVMAGSSVAAAAMFVWTTVDSLKKKRAV